MGNISALASDLVAAASDPYAVLFCILGLSFMLLSSVLSVRSLKKIGGGDLPAAIGYFTSFFLLVFAAPIAYLLAAGSAGLTPSSFGLRIGDWRLGGILVLIGIPFSAVVHFVGSKNPTMRNFYPFSKDATKSLGSFIAYEAAYLLLYYVAWEFAFRGIMLFSLVSLLPRSPGGVAVAIMAQTALSTVFHIGHPNSEIAAALVAGIAFGIIALATGSILYTIAIHAMIGIFEDTMAYRRRSRWPSALENP
jgi:membrane protease YdiL (CAAX protease family)